MSVSLASISFSRASSDGAHGLNLRKNATESISLPEWRPNLSNEVKESVAAYAIEDVILRPPIIHAEFVTDLPVERIQIRAVHPPLPPFNDRQRFWLQTQVNVLGEVPAQWISLTQDKAAITAIKLRHDRVVTRGVGVHRVVWHWQYRTRRGEAWRDLTVTRHTIYTILRRPTAPWVQQPLTDLHLPWTEVLDYACRWAAGTHTPSAAATAITRSVFNLGGNKLIYDSVLGASRYSFPFFNCTEILKQLRQGSPVGPLVNCSDCASIVSTFANILGCDLWQSQMGTLGQLFLLNLIVPIGLPAWQRTALSPGFSYHEVAWTGACREDDVVYDACLAVDAYGNPSIPPRLPALATNTRFGQLGEPLYRFRLAAQATRHLCAPRPETRQRRKLLFAESPVRDVAPLSSQQDARRRFIEPQLATPPDSETFFAHRFGLHQWEFSPEWHHEIIDTGPPQPDGRRYSQAILRSATASSSASIRIECLECGSAAEAQDSMLAFAARSEIAAFQDGNQTDIGAESIEHPGGMGLIFRRGNLMCSVIYNGTSEVPFKAVARSLDASLVARPHNTEASEDLVNLEPLDEVAEQSMRFHLKPGRVAIGDNAIEGDCVRFFARGGEVRRQDGELFFFRSSEEQPSLEVLATSDSGVSQRQQCP